MITPVPDEPVRLGAPAAGPAGSAEQELDRLRAELKDYSNATVTHLTAIGQLNGELAEARAEAERLKTRLAELADQWDAQSADDRDEAMQLAAYGMSADRKATLRAAAVREAHAAALRKLGTS